MPSPHNYHTTTTVAALYLQTAFHRRFSSSFQEPPGLPSKTPKPKIMGRSFIKSPSMSNKDDLIRSLRPVKTPLKDDDSHC
mmetsp:Transcript_58395/g.94471  ORF Transcript_58395/g.94471 Transcript_58395/m.94471 type:complete len:81 (-) Transcript_58395:907-1149(-)